MTSSCCGVKRKRLANVQRRTAQIWILHEIRHVNVLCEHISRSQTVEWCLTLTYFMGKKRETVFSFTVESVKKKLAQLDVVVFFFYSSVRRDISGTSFFRCGSNIHLDSEMNWLVFGGQRSKFSVISKIQLKNSLLMKNLKMSNDILVLSVFCVTSDLWPLTPGCVSLTATGAFVLWASCNTKTCFMMKWVIEKHTADAMDGRVSDSVLHRCWFRFICPCLTCSVSYVRSLRQVQLPGVCGNYMNTIIQCNDQEWSASLKSKRLSLYHRLFFPPSELKIKNCALILLKWSFVAKVKYKLCKLFSTGLEYLRIQFKHDSLDQIWLLFCDFIITQTLNCTGSDFCPDQTSDICNNNNHWWWVLFVSLQS